MADEHRAPARPDVKQPKPPDLLSKKAAATMKAPPVGQVAAFHKSAQQWWDSQRRYFIVTLSLGGTIATYTKANRSEGNDISGILQAIESVGWELRDIGYVYQPLKEQSHAFSDSAHMTGDILGIYTFVKPAPE